MASYSKTTIHKLITFTLLLCLSASLFGQQKAITIKENQIKTTKLLKLIAKEGNVEFSYNSKLVDPKRTLNFSISKATLTQTLDLLATKLQVQYEQIDDQVILKPTTNNQQGNTPPPKKKSTVTLSGLLQDQQTGETLINATVAIKGTTKGVFSNAFGFYSLSLPAGAHTFVFSYIGYDEQEVTLDLQKNTAKNIFLNTTKIDLPPVTVGLPLRELLNKKQAGNSTLTPNELGQFPEFGGESGLTKGLQSLPGIKMHSDGSAGFYSRGGERDQNLMLIDDAPIYNPSHLFGFYSVVIPDFAKSITVYQDDIPASLGDQLSSIISIRTKDGNLNKMELGGSINPFMSRITVELPIVKEKSAVFTTFRRSSLGLYGATPNNNNNSTYQFHDFHFKWNYKISKKNRIYFTLLQISDLIKNKNTGAKQVNWGNFASTLRWNYIISPKLFSNTTIYTGTYAFHVNLLDNLWRSELGNLSFRTDFTHYISEKIKTKFGVEFQGYFIRPGETTRDSSLAFLPQITSDYSSKAVLYYQANYKITDQLTLDAGLRFSSWKNNGPKTYFLYDENYLPVDTVNVGSGTFNKFDNLDPRISLQYTWKETNQVKLSYGRYHQYLQILSNTVSPFSVFDIWQPANQNLAPPVSSQYALSYLRYLQAAKLQISLAGYYKQANNIIDYAPNTILLDNPHIEASLRQGQSSAYGAEFLVKKEQGKLNGWFSYNYSRVFRQTKGLNDDSPYRALQDRPHEISLVVNYDLSKRIALSGYWTSFSGATFSAPTSFFTYQNQTVPVYGEMNNDRLPAYHRMDISFKLRLNRKQSSRFQHSLMFSLYNAIGHKNVYAVKFNKLEADILQNPTVPRNVITQQDLVPTKVDLIRFFPSLTYKFKIRA